MPLLLPLLFLLAAAPSAGAKRAPPTPPPSDYGGAAPLNQGKWFDFTDYPGEAIAAGEEGYVTVAFDILASGRVGRCEVARSSGSKRLDAVPCRLLRRRARFAPARGPDGAARATRGTTSMSFWLPGR
ncbi:MAG: TonB family protein [Allosphingosinicella sp.]